MKQVGMVSSLLSVLLFCAPGLSRAQTTASLWNGTTAPAPAQVDPDTTAVEVGVRFQSSAPGVLDKVRFYRDPAAALTTSAVHVWSASGALLASSVWVGEGGPHTGWVTLDLYPDVPLAANTQYVVSYHAPEGRYTVTEGAFTSGYTAGVLSVPVDGGVYGYGPRGTFPTESWNHSNYWVEPLVKFSPPETPLFLRAYPGNNAAAVRWDAASGAQTYAVLRATSEAGPYQTVASGLTRTAWLDTNVMNGIAYFYQVRASNTYGTSAPSYRATVTPAPTAYSLWQTPAPSGVFASDDTDGVELGVRFKSDVPGIIDAVRFYRDPGAPLEQRGVHLWDAQGVLLATGLFVGEGGPGSGWQTVDLYPDVAVQENTAYTVSYYAPNGGYTVASQAFVIPYYAQPLHVEADGGVFAYGPSGTFPTLSWESSNYWVEPIFRVR
ncbi:DUF4082 domain-containing protein [Corallococcus sp. CA053C]|uniref:DUF4082 domain-containing protein n=1 Tax=Corallococcus sp. CA053C TaxID=2316732 RepID=UPI000EA112BE|nr:DUF4082 domain-containing protein [Corallococcus sp. CA053C]RKH10478.1 DUF4082 domain-containing protein [Corallococcus sp. CA053C]